MRVMVGIGVGVITSTGNYNVTITSPAPGAEFVVGVATAVSLYVPMDQTYECSFDSDFANIRGTITVTGGVGTGNVTAAGGDAGSLSLYVREVGGTTARATLACTVVCTPNSISGGVSGWWETYVGSWTPSDASVPADLNTWDSNAAVTVAGNAVKATVSNSRHYCYQSNPTNDVGTWCDVSLAGTMTGAQAWVRVWAGADWANVNLVTGALGNKSGATVTASVAVGSAVVYFRRVVARDCRVELLEPALGDDATATPAVYVGNVADGITVASCTFRQERLSAIADLSRVGGGGALRNAHLTKADITQQPLFQDTLETLNGLPVPLRETGRVSYLTSLNADVLAVASGDDPAFALFGITGGSGDYLAPCRWRNDATGGYDQPLVINGAQLSYTRHDGGGFSTGNYGALAASIATPVPFALICNTDRSRELWLPVAGVMSLVSTVILANLGSAAMTAFTWGYDSQTTPNQIQSALVVMAGQVPGVTAADRYEVLRLALQTMAARWGLTA